MNKLPSNARLAFLRPANPWTLNALTASRIIGVALPVTIASTHSATAHIFFLQPQRRSTNTYRYFPALSQDSQNHATSLTVHNRLTVYESFTLLESRYSCAPPLDASAGTVPFTGQGRANNNIHHPAVLALRTGKARFALRERVEPYAWSQIPESNWHILLGRQSVFH